MQQESLVALVRQIPETSLSAARGRSDITLVFLTFAKRA